MRALTFRRSPLRAAPALLAIVLASMTTIASADPNAPTDEQRSAARLLGTDGVKAALAGDCTTAVDKLTRAEALVHAPTTAVPLGECQIKLGKIVAGTEILNHVVHETLPPNAPTSWVDAKKRAQPILDAAEPKIAKLRVHVDRPAGTTGDPEITIDGEPMSAVLLDNIRPTDPGRHHIEAKQTGFIATSTDVTLGEGEAKSVTLSLEPAPGATASIGTTTKPLTDGTTTTPTTTTTTTTPPVDHPPPSPPNRTPAYIVMGIGGAGLIAGTVFGILALGNKSSLDSACVSKVCPASSQSDIDGMHTNSIVSTVAFAVGALGIGIGGVLFLTAHPSDMGTPTASARGVTVQPWLGLGAAGLRGSFQ